MPKLSHGAVSSNAVFIQGGRRFESRFRHHISGPRRWRDRIIAVGSLSGFMGGMVMIAIIAFLPFYVQRAMGRSPAAVGLALGAASIS